MPHHGQYEHVKEWLQDHDTDEVDENPPVQNTWYEIFHAQDVRLLHHSIYQKNDEAVAKDIQVRWTIDGNVYHGGIPLGDDITRYIYRSMSPSAAGTAGLGNSVTQVGAGYEMDKRGLDFKVEVRMIGVPGTNQQLLSRCIRETLEVT